MLMDHESLHDRDHKRLALFIDKVAGIQLPAHKRSLIESRLRKRLLATGRDQFKTYLDWALSDTGEQVMLIDALTTNKTDFFREAGHFEFLMQYLQQRLVSEPHKARYRFWSAGCSSGEEPYTLAMVLQNIKEDYPHFNYSIEATDISPSVLATAQQGIYHHSLVQPVPIAYRKKYLLRKKNKQLDLVKVSPELKRNICFESFNLVTGNFATMGEFDGIFCRNVMIYFSQAQRQIIITQFAQALSPQGLFFIGHSEGLSGQQFGLNSLIPTVYQKNE
ncbi:CheR family methyltransferase [Celerinatantimonas yamalensis]|uniref:Chemotaxis protein methyltransferase n=1 Tax=Celerinatantimonas yamalensis TaxID=559956 RepID=A0ABW9G539_9GAMM